ncbi:MAG: TonB-dependent receptor [Gemmatimonadales bacterium]
MKAAIVALAFAMSVPVLLPAQAPGIVEGQVLDAATGAPVTSAKVEIASVSGAVGADGRFRLGGLPLGPAVLVVTAVGYRPNRTEFELLPGLTIERTVRLDAMPPVLPEISVQAARGQGGMLGHEALVQRGSDLASALDGWEGVVVRRSGGNGPASPQVRGSAPEEVIVLVDGFAINDPLTGRADLSRLATRDVASVHIRPGAQSAGGAGTAVGGVIDIRSQARGDADISGWMGSHGSGGGTLASSIAGVRLFVRGERLADDFPYLVPANRGGGEAIRGNAGGTIGSLSFRRSGAVAVQGRASASSRGLPGSVGNETPNATAEDRAAFLGVTITGGSTLSGSVQYLRTRAADPAPPTGAAYDVQSTGWSGTADWSIGLPLVVGGWQGDIELGAAARHDTYQGAVVRDGTQFSRGGVRAIGTFRPAAAAPWSLTPSLRLDWWTGETAPLGSARLDAGWRKNGTALQASVGSAVSAPPLADLFFREGVGVALNPTLRPERVAWEVELGVTQDWSVLGSPATASVRGYYGRVDDMILWAPGAGFIWSPRNFDVIRRGVDGSLSVRFLRSVTVAVQGAWTPVTYDVPGGAQVQYRPVGTWGASAGWVSAGWGADARWRWVGERYPNPGGVNPRPAYGVMDIGAERAIGTAIVRADLRDLFDTRAEFLAGYPSPGRTAVVSISLEWQ